MNEVSPYGAPLFAPLRHWLERLPPHPDTQAVAALAEEFPLYGENGQRIRFVPPPAGDLAYECRIWETGEVATRPNNWHDFFNALVWLTFPKTKIAVSASHVRAMTPAGEARGIIRDTLTHFDECGIVVVSSQPALLDLLRDFQWKTLFVERRAEVLRDMRFIIFGHATYEQLLQPFRGLTAKAILHEVDADWPQLSLPEQIAAVDCRLAVELSSGRYRRPRDFQPLPLLGIPGMTPDNEHPAYYDDTWQFRPGRRAQAEAVAA